MGLDMYLERIPRIEGVTMNECIAYDEWKEYQNKYLGEPLREGETEKCSFAEWSPYGAKYEPADEKKVLLAEFYDTKYYAWDDEKKYPHQSVVDCVCYWRKANAIHKWFVDKVQNGVDDCGCHDEVTKELLEELVGICKAILLCRGAGVGEIIADKVLPTTSGFFFGGTEYDDWYYDDLEHTVETLEKVIEDTDFDKYALYYNSSW